MISDAVNPSTLSLIYWEINNLLKIDQNSLNDDYRKNIELGINKFKFDWGFGDRLIVRLF